MKQIKIFNLSERKKVKLILLILGSKKKLHSSRVINLIERGELSPFLLWSKSRNESLPFFFFFFPFFPFLAISVEELSGSGWHFSNLMFIRIPNAPPILIFLLSPVPYAFSISQRFPRIPVYFPGVLYISQIPDFSSFLIQPVLLHCLIYLSQIPPLYFYYSCTPHFRLRYSSRFFY